MQVTHGSENELKQPHPSFMLFLSAWGKIQGVLGPKKTVFFSKEDNWEIRYVKGSTIALLRLR
jgi:hypothetical protein